MQRIGSKMRFLIVLILMCAIVPMIYGRGSTSSVAGYFALPIPNIILGFGVTSMKLSIAGRLLGIIADWFSNRGPSGVTVSKELMDVSRPIPVDDVGDDYPDPGVDMFARRTHDASPFVVEQEPADHRKHYRGYSSDLPSYQGDREENRRNDFRRDHQRVVGYQNIGNIRNSPSYQRSNLFYPPLPNPGNNREDLPTLKEWRLILPKVKTANVAAEVDVQNTDLNSKIPQFRATAYNFGLPSAKTPTLSNQRKTVDENIVGPTIHQTIQSEPQNSYESLATKIPGEFHRIVKRRLLGFAEDNEEESKSVLSSGEIFLDAKALEKFFSQTRTFNQAHCVLKMVCYLGANAESKSGSYRSRIARFFSQAWEKYHPKFMDSFFGYEESLVIGRTHSHSGCVLKYNSCPMSVINTIYLSMNLQKIEQQR